MLQPLSLYSEEFTPQGNIAAEGILNQLGKPGLDLLSLLVRETVQNSRDARLGEENAVDFALTGRTLSSSQLEYLRTVVLTGSPENLNLQEMLANAASSGARVLIISDRGTTGLNGPIRANAEDDTSKSRNFVNFFYNTGQSKGKQFSGGTYGYGKSVLYRISMVHTICVYTRCRVNGRLESRFMAAALAPHNEEQASYRLHTGRHWWGRRNGRDDILDPVLGEDADEIARGLGLPAFKDQEQGTTCMVLLPSLGELSFEETMQYISRLLLWYAWPAMIAASNHMPAMNFSVSYEDQPIPIPDPSRYPPLKGFVQAMSFLRNTTADKADYLDQITAISSQRPKQLLGRLALSRFLIEDRTDPFLQSSENPAGVSFPISRNSHHVALLRNTDLVIRYWEGSALPVSNFEYAGVFVADRAVDAIFAKAEPPTHDDWNPQTLDRTEKVFVNVALNKIKETVREFTSPAPVGNLEGEVQPLGAFADKLGSFLFGVKGAAGYIPPSNPPKQKQNITQEQNTNGLYAGNSGSNGHNPDIQQPQPDLPAAEGNETSNNDNLSPFKPENLFGPELQNGDEPVNQESASPDRPLDSTNHNNNQGHPQGDKVPSGPRKPAKIHLLDEGHLEILEDHPVVMTSFRIDHAAGSHATDVEVQTSILLDNGSEETEPLPDKLQPEVFAWITSEGKLRSGSEAIRIPSTDAGVWQVAVIIPDDAMVQVNLTVSEVR